MTDQEHENHNSPSIFDIEYWQEKALSGVPAVSVEECLILEVALLTQELDDMRSLIERAAENGVSIGMQKDADLGRMIAGMVRDGATVTISHEGATVKP